MATDVLIIVVQMITLLAFCGFAYYAKGWFTSLKGTVDTQAKTIATLQSVIDVADTPKMLDRIQGYKKFVDEEKEAAIADLQRQFAEERKAMGSGAERLKACEEFLSHSTAFLFELFAYTPRANRQQLIKASRFHDHAKSILMDAADKVPDLSQSVPGLLAAMGITPGTGSIGAMGRPPEMRLSDMLSDPSEKK
jgi:hypothetical protein